MIGKRMGTTVVVAAFVFFALTTPAAAEWLTDYYAGASITERSCSPARRTRRRCLRGPVRASQEIRRRTAVQDRDFRARTKRKILSHRHERQVCGSRQGTARAVR